MAQHFLLAGVIQLEYENLGGSEICETWIDDNLIIEL